MSGFILNSDLIPEVAITTNARKLIHVPGSTSRQMSVASDQRKTSKKAPAKVTQSLLDLCGKSQASLTLQ